MRVQLGRSVVSMEGEDNQHKVIRDFLEKNGGTSVVAFFDEFPVTYDDKNYAADDGEYVESNLVKTLECIKKNSRQAWVALRTADLLEMGGGTGSPPDVPLDQLHQHL